MLQRLQPTAFVVSLVLPLSLLGAWKGSAQALEPGCAEGLTTGESHSALQSCLQGQPMGKVADIAQEVLGDIHFQVQPDLDVPGTEWTTGIQVPLGSQTKLFGGYRTHTDAISLTGSERHWQPQAILGAKHQWDVRPGMKLDVTYERELVNLQGLGQRKTEKQPDSHIRLKLDYASQQQNSAGEALLNTNLGYEYHHQPGDAHQGSAHLLKAGATYQPNWRWQIGGNFDVQQQSEETAVSAQAKLRHRLHNRFDVGGDLRWSQGIGEEGEASGLGAAVEMGYHVNSQIRLSTGYALGEMEAQTSHSSQSVGPYVGIEFK